MSPTTLAYVLFLVLSNSAPLALAEPVSVDKLVQAYPDWLVGHDDEFLIWRDGTRMPLSDGREEKSFDEKLRSPSILDQLSLPYVSGPLSEPPPLNHDPGRFRNLAFFNKMYGDCFKGEVQKKLSEVPWLPTSRGLVRITVVNHVDEKLREISAEIDGLPAALKKYAVPSAGTFNCRDVKDTGNRSMHAWAAAIDINTQFSDYWLWSKNGGYQNRIPFEIVGIFERHGFIWGGKWNHYDTMHFEYRPELID
jgi:hypothetical protein